MQFVCPYSMDGTFFKQTYVQPAGASSMKLDVYFMALADPPRPCFSLTLNTCEVSLGGKISSQVWVYSEAAKRNV